MPHPVAFRIGNMNTYGSEGPSRRGARNYRAMFLGIFRKHAPDRCQTLDDFLIDIVGYEDQAWRETLEQYEGQNKSSCDNRDLPPDVCRICGEKGHWGRECPNNPS